MTQQQYERNKNIITHIHTGKQNVYPSINQAKKASRGLQRNQGQGYLLIHNPSPRKDHRWHIVTPEGKFLTSCATRAGARTLKGEMENKNVTCKIIDTHKGDK